MVLGEVVVQLLKIQESWHSHVKQQNVAMLSFVEHGTTYPFSLQARDEGKEESLPV